MIGKGWTWLGSDGAISTLFNRAQNLQHAMQGLIGFRPCAGSGRLFNSVYKEMVKITSDKNRNVRKIKLKVYVV